MRLICVTDNCVQRSSRLWGEHGLSFWLETADGAVLWDTGQTSAVLAHNLQALQLEARPAAVAVSHAHYDHTGALRHVLEQHPGLIVYGNASLFDPRFSRSGDRLVPIGMQGEPAEWQALATFSLSDAPQGILPGVGTTGLIAHRPHPQGASPAHVVLRGGQACPDPYADDMSLLLHVSGGVVLLCGCCHAGLRNTLLTVRALSDEPLVAIIGGTHLAEAAEHELAALVELLRREGPVRLYLNHCTGDKPLFTLRSALGERVSPCPAGTVLTFD